VTVRARFLLLLALRWLPVGLMIVGRQFEDTTCLRVARAVETLAGGFPTPPAA